MSDSLWTHGLYSPWNALSQILEWVAVPSSRGSSQPRDWTQVSGIAIKFFIIWATREAQNGDNRGVVFSIEATFIRCTTSLLDQTVKNSLAMQETWVQFLGQEDPLEKGMATHSSILAWRTPWAEEPGGLQSMGLQRVRNNWASNTLGLPWWLSQ